MMDYGLGRMIHTQLGVLEHSFIFNLGSIPNGAGSMVYIKFSWLLTQHRTECKDCSETRIRSSNNRSPRMKAMDDE